MSLDNQLEAKINSFMERKQNEIPELRQSPTRLYRKLLAEERREHREIIDASEKRNVGQWAMNSPMKFASF